VSGELNAWWRTGIPIVTPILRLLFRVRIEGLEHVPARGPAILAFNHVSVLDGPVLAIETARRLKRESRFLVAAEQFRRPLVGWILRRYEQIPIRRGEGDTSALDEAITTIRKGALAAVAPEGRVNDDGALTLQRLRRGLARIALPTGAPIVPVGVWGTQHKYPRGGWTTRRPWRPKLGLAFGPPLLPEGDAETPSDVDALTDRLRTHLERQVERARSLAGDGARRRRKDPDRAG
jgi:1-acyl-sn-glycerol-3-phosphate acyltransferase